MKDALGHGSDPKGAHSEGVQNAGKRYHVKVTPYSLDAGTVGQINGSPMTLSMHNSLAAAGRSLGSAIRGNKVGDVKRFLGSNGGQYLIHDQMTGNTYTREGAKTGVDRDSKGVSSSEEKAKR